MVEDVKDRGGSGYVVEHTKTPLDLYLLVGKLNENKIVLSYRFIILVYYLLAFLIIIMNINHLERVLIYSLILIVLFGLCDEYLYNEYS